MRFVLVRTDRPGMAERRAKLQPAHIAYQQPFLPMIKFGGGMIEDGVDTSADVDIRNVVGNVLVFEVPNRKVVEKFHANDPYTLEDIFEFQIIKPLWQRVPALD